MKNSQSWGPKSRFLLRCLYAGWCPVTKFTHKHVGKLRSNLFHHHLVLFKRNHFMVFGRDKAILQTLDGIVAEITYYRHNYLPNNPFKVLWHIRNTTKWVAVDLEAPELGIVPVVKYKKDIFFKFWNILEDFVAKNGKAPNQSEFYQAVEGVTNKQLAREVLKTGEGKYWTIKKTAYPRQLLFYPKTIKEVSEQHYT